MKIIIITMIKSELLLISIVWVSLCAARDQENRIMLYVPPEHLIGFRKNAEICGNEHGVDPQDVRKIMDWTLPDDVPHKHFLYCVLVKSKYIDEEANIKIDEASKFTPVNATQDDARRGYEECNNLRRENVLDTTYKAAACYHKHFVLTLQKPEAPKV